MDVIRSGLGAACVILVDEAVLFSHVLVKREELYSRKNKCILEKKCGEEKGENKEKRVRN